jgi:hypothetical protein
LQNTIRPAVEVLIGRTMAQAGETDWERTDKQDRGDYLEMNGIVTNKTHGEAVNVKWLYPKKWDGRAVVWLDDNGQASLTNNAAVLKLVHGGVAVVGADLLFQTGEPVKQTRVVDKNPREFAGYTFGYNHALFAQRTHDVLTLVNFLRNGKVGTHPNPKSVAVVGWGNTGPIVAAARAIAGEAIDRAAVDTKGFRFGHVLDYRDPMFLPAGAKYLDLPGMIALSSPHPLWLAGEGKEPLIIRTAYRNAGKADALSTFEGDAAMMVNAAAEWLLK